VRFSSTTLFTFKCVGMRKKIENVGELIKNKLINFLLVIMWIVNCKNLGELLRGLEFEQLFA